jgi:hypothetical protein
MLRRKNYHSLTAAAQRFFDGTRHSTLNSTKTTINGMM